MGCQGSWGEETDPLCPAMIVDDDDCPHAWLECGAESDPTWLVYQCKECGALRTVARQPPSEGCCG